RSVEDTFALPDCVVHLTGGDVFTLPSEGIADAIDKIKKPLLVELHEVAGAKPCIALRKDVAQYLLFGLGSVGVTLETAAALIRDADATDGLSNLTARTGHAQAMVVAQWKAAFGIDLDDCRRKTMRQ